MHKIYHIWLRFVLLLAMTFVVIAVPAQHYHQFGVSIDGGWASFVPKADGVKTGTGMLYGGGLVYEYQYQHLLLTTGLDFQWRRAGLRVADDCFLHEKTLYDSQNTPYHLQVATTRRTDYVHQFAVQIPIMAGAVYQHFYGLAGVKIAIPLVNTSHTRALVSTDGAYDRYQETVGGMPVHGYRSYVPVNAGGQTVDVAPFDLRASLELGYNYIDQVGRPYVNTISHVRMRVALFVDYSLFPQGKSTIPGPLVAVADENPLNISQYTFTNILNTDKMQNAYLAGINVGVKLTFLFGNRRRFYCSTCD